MAQWHKIQLQIQTQMQASGELFNATRQMATRAKSANVDCIVQLTFAVLCLRRFNFCTVSQKTIHRWLAITLTHMNELAATLRWFTAGGAIRIAVRQLSQTWKLRHYDVITRKL